MRIKTGGNMQGARCSQVRGRFGIERPYDGPGSLVPWVQNQLPLSLPLRLWTSDEVSGPHCPHLQSNKSFLLHPIVMTFTSVHKVLIRCVAHSKSTQVVSCDCFLINVSHHYFCSLPITAQPLPFVRSFARQMLPEG